MELNQQHKSLNVWDVAHKSTQRLIFMIVIALLVSCNPHKKLQRLVKKHPELMVKDTMIVEIHDTIIINKSTHDTVTQFFHSDTVQVIDNSTLTLKYFYDTITRNIYHDVLVKQDTLFYYKEIPVEVDKVIIKELTWWEKNNQWVWVLLAIFGGSLIFQKLKKSLLL